MENNNNFQFEQNEENQPTQTPFGMPVGENQPTQTPFGMPVGENRPTQTPFGMPVGENQSTQTPFGTPIEGNQPVQNKKKRAIIIVSSLCIVVALCLATVLGMFALNVFNKPSNTPQTENSSSNAKESKQTEFTIELIESQKNIYKLKDIKRDVKVTKDLAKSSVYVFEVENKGDQDTRYLSLDGVTKDGGIVRPVYEYNVENSSILENNNCKASNYKIPKNGTERICLVYPTTISKILVPKFLNKTIAYQPVMIDDEGKSSSSYVVEHKNKGEELVFKGYQGDVESTTSLSEVKEAKNEYGQDIFAIDLTLSIKKDSRSASSGYERVLVELEDGTFYTEEYSDYKTEGSLSTLEFSKKISEPVKQGDKIRHTVVFTKADKKIKNIIFENENYKNTQTITTIFAQ